ncbi:MAG: recombinase family protein [Bdellovibrionales bacterium]|nr:recombinase family protein [Bdellovibrionales bacterium]
MQYVTIEVGGVLCVNKYPAFHLGMLKMELPYPGMEAKKFVLYLRVSSLEQNTDLQRLELTDYAKKRGWDYQILEDKATGRNSNRPALKKLMQLAQTRKIDGIAVWRADRLFRSLKEAVITLSALTELNVAFYSHKDGIDLSTSSGRLLANLLFSLAEFESELTRSRVIAGLHAAKARGVRLGRPVIVNDEIIKQVLALRSEGVSIRGISERLGRQVSKSSIERILRDFNNSLKKSAL